MAVRHRASLGVCRPLRRRLSRPIVDAQQARRQQQREHLAQAHPVTITAARSRYSSLPAPGRGSIPKMLVSVLIRIDCRRTSGREPGADDGVLRCGHPPAASAAVLEAEGGLLSGMGSGRIWMEMSNTDEAEVRWLGAKVEALGGEPEAPGHEAVPMGRD